MSEDGEGDGSGMRLSEEILSDMKVMQPVAWVYWQAVDGGGWGLLNSRLDSPVNYAYTVNEKYYVFGQYTKFIRPGDTLINIDDAHSLAALNARANRLVIVTTNGTDTATSVTYDLGRFRRLPAVVKTVQTSATQKLSPLPDIPLADKKLTAALPARSVTTFVIDGISIP